MSEGHIELAWAVDAIKVGRRVRVDLGDIDELAASIQATGGLLQPITITPDGWLVCGRRRLVAVKKLGWTTVNVWVRTGISSPVAILLAEQEENTARKALTITEATTIYRELKALTGEDAARRQQATWLHGADGQQGGAGPAKFAAPGRARDQAAAFVGFSHTTLDKVAAVQDAAHDEHADPMVREVAAGRMALIEQTGRVDPHYQAVRAAQQQAAHVAAEALARAKAARARPASKREPERREPPTEPARWSPRAFVVMLTDTDYWWAHYDPGELAARLTGEQWALLEDWQANTDAFLADVRSRRRASA